MQIGEPQLETQSFKKIYRLLSKIYLKIEKLQNLSLMRQFNLTLRELIKFNRII